MRTHPGCLRWMCTCRFLLSEQVTVMRHFYLIFFLCQIKSCATVSDKCVISLSPSFLISLYQDFWSMLSPGKELSVINTAGGKLQTWPYSAYEWPQDHISFDPIIQRTWLCPSVSHGNLCLSYPNPQHLRVCHVFMREPLGPHWTAFISVT